jgi:hypothetical protein
MRCQITKQHNLSSKKGRLIIFCHNKLNGEVSYLGAKAMTPSTVCDEPLIQAGHGTAGSKVVSSPTIRVQSHHTRYVTPNRIPTSLGVPAE